VTTQARTAPQRTCVACRRTRDKRDLVRVVRSPEGSVSFDASGRLPGRGAYLCADGACWATALKKSSIERALSVKLPADMRGQLEQGGPLLLGGAHGS
jgi:uncharacterized protein